MTWVLLLASCAPTPPPAPITLTPASYGDLPGWGADHLSDAIPAFQKSCGMLMQKAPETSMNIAALHMDARDWQSACTALAQVPEHDDAAARAYFEKYFQPYAVSGAESRQGLFTGYYEAELHGSPQRDDHYQTPLYGKPRDLIAVDLGDFDPEWKGKHIAGKVEQQKLEPYDNRSEIENNGLQDRADVLLWVDSPVDAFFLAVQGSGRVTLDGGGAIRVGFEASNGRHYVAIGHVMEEAGDIPKPVTMQKIRDWLAAHPTEAKTVMDTNPSYVFFRILEGDGPVGAEGVVLTPRRSLAIDPAFIRLGTPVWLDSTDGIGAPLQKLFIAQDTGGAIKGAVRGDVFWGYGSDAATEAGAMQSDGKYYVLLPRNSLPAP